MKCPNCKSEMHKISFNKLNAWHCKVCLGFLISHDEMSRLSGDETFNWVDMELWQNVEKFKLGQSARLCPYDDMCMYKIEYDGIVLDGCLEHKIVFFDRGEILKIKTMTLQRLGEKTFGEFMMRATDELTNIIAEPQYAADDFKHFLLALDLASHRLAAKLPLLSQITAKLPQ